MTEMRAKRTYIRYACSLRQPWQLRHSSMRKEKELRHMEYCLKLQFENRKLKSQKQSRDNQIQLMRKYIQILNKENKKQKFLTDNQDDKEDIQNAIQSNQQIQITDQLIENSQSLSIFYKILYLSKINVREFTQTQKLKILSDLISLEDLIESKSIQPIVFWQFGQGEAPAYQEYFKNLENIVILVELQNGKKLIFYKQGRIGINKQQQMCFVTDINAKIILKPKTLQNCTSIGQSCYIFGNSQLGFEERSAILYSQLGLPSRFSYFNIQSKKQDISDIQQTDIPKILLGTQYVQGKMVEIRMKSIVISQVKL